MTNPRPSELLHRLIDSAHQRDWKAILDPFDGTDPPAVSLHLAILVQPYLGFILDGSKKVESRFSVRASPPYRCVQRGDVVLLKQSSGPIVGAFTASAVWYYRLDRRSWSEVRREFSDAMRAQDGFWEQRSAAEYATLIRTSRVRRLPPITIPKKDRRGWVILTERDRRDYLL